MKPAENLSLERLESFFDFSIIQTALISPVIQGGLAEAVKKKYPEVALEASASGKMFDLAVCGTEDLNNFAPAAGHILIIGGAGHSEVQKAEDLGFARWREAEQKIGTAVFRTWKFLKPHSSYFIQQVNSDDSNHHIYHKKSGLYYMPLQQAFLDLIRKISAAAGSGQAASIVRASDGDYYFLRKVEIGSAKPGRRALTKGYESINIPEFKRQFWQNDIIAVSIEPPFHNSWKKFLFYEKFDKFFWKLNFKFRGENIFKYLNYAFDKIFSPLIKRKIFLRLITRNHEHKDKAHAIINKTQTPMEAVYALVPSKWLFRNFKNQIGIIAGSKKCELIKLLMQRQVYKDYIGMDEFTDYVAVPQKGAADNLEALAKEVGEKIKNSRAKIFLVGVGSAKLGLLPLLKQYKNAVFIDVGAGIDALAGVVCQERPYFCEWTDFRIKNYDYGKVDFMDQGNPAWENPEYITRWLE